MGIFVSLSTCLMSQMGHQTACRFGWRTIAAFAALGSSQRAIGDCAQLQLATCKLGPNQPTNRTQNPNQTPKPQPNHKTTTHRLGASRKAHQTRPQAAQLAPKAVDQPQATSVHDRRAHRPNQWAELELVGLGLGFARFRFRFRLGLIGLIGHKRRRCNRNLAAHLPFRIK